MRATEDVQFEVMTRDGAADQGLLVLDRSGYRGRARFIDRRLRSALWMARRAGEFSLVKG